ncbi:hypothetical protein JCM6882_005660 [Rhodosporidiobolus microsporus]
MDSTTQPHPPPRTSSLASPPHPHPAPPPPLVASLPPSLPLSPDAEANPAPPPPSYDQAAASSPQRFKRWAGPGGWIEKRARERRDERDELRRMGRVRKGGWDLPPSAGEKEEEKGGEEGTGEGRWGEGRGGEEVVRGTERLSLYDPGAWEQGRRGGDTGGALSAGGSGKGKGKATPTTGSNSFSQRLTKNVALHRVGGRFSRGVTERPLCGVGLPTQGGASDERFVLIGTLEGLHLIDLLPSLSTAHSRLSTASLPSQQGEDASIVPLWSGLPVRQLEVFSDSGAPGGRDGRGEGPRGIVLGLVGKEGEAEVRMWSLANLVQLAQWRVHDPNSLPLDLPRLTNSLHTRARSSSSSSLTPSSPISDPRRASSYHNEASPLHPSGASLSPPSLGAKGKKRLLHPASPPTSASAAGAHAALVGAATPALVRASSTEAEYLLVDSLPSPSAYRPSQPSGLPSPSPSPSPSSPLERLALPLEWATTSVPLPLPAASGGGGSGAAGNAGGKGKDGRPGALFFRLCRTPPAVPAPSSEEAREEEEEEDDDSDSLDEDLPASERRRREEARAERGRLFLFVATKGSVFLFESRPPAAGGGGGRRTWALTKEFFAPSTPKALHLIRLASSPKPSTSSRSPPPAYPPSLHLLLLTSHRLVLIRLADSSVREVALSLGPSAAPRLSSFTSSSARMTRARSGSAGSTTSASSLSLSSARRQHRPTSSLATLGANLKESLRDSAVLAKVQAFVEAKSGAVPVGMRGEMGGVQTGRKRSVDKGRGMGGAGGAGGGEEEYLAGAMGEAGGGKWTACAEVALPAGLFPARPHRRRDDPSSSSDCRLLLLTKGAATYLFPLPLPLSSSSFGDVDGGAVPGTSTTSGAAADYLRPLWTFQWPSISPPILKTATTLSPLSSQHAHLALTAFTPTGLAVQEGVVSLAALAGAFSASSALYTATGSARDEPFFRPLPASGPFSPPPGVSPSSPQAASPWSPTGDDDDEESDDDDLGSTATLDFGRETGWLCASSSRAGSGGGGGGGFFFTRAHSDYSVKRVRVNVPAVGGAA